MANVANTTVKMVSGATAAYVFYMAYLRNERGFAGRKWKRALSNVFMEKMEKHMERFRSGYLNSVEWAELEPYSIELIKRGVARKGPNGLRIIRPIDPDDEPSMEDSAGSEAEAIREDAMRLAAKARKAAAARRVQRTSPSKYRTEQEMRDAALTEVPIPNVNIETVPAKEDENIEKNSTDKGGTNDENLLADTETSPPSPKKLRYD